MSLTLVRRCSERGVLVQQGVMASSWRESTHRGEPSRTVSILEHCRGVFRDVRAIHAAGMRVAEASAGFNDEDGHRRGKEGREPRVQQR